MFKISEYFYIFTKLTISMLMLGLIIIMGFLLAKSYKDAGGSKDLEETMQSISQIVNLNKQSFLNTKVKLNNSAESIKKINKKLDKINKEYQFLQYDQQIEKLTISNQSLQKQIKELKIFFNNSQTSNEKFNISNFEQVNFLVEIMITKFKNNESMSDEIKLLKNLIPANNQQIFEKLYVVDASNFYGFKNFNEEFDSSLNIFIKNKFLKKNQNNVFNFILKFVEVKPSNLSVYEDDDLNSLILAKKYFQNEDIPKSLNKILEIDKGQIFFKKWIHQAKLYIEFNSTIDQLR